MKRFWLSSKYDTDPPESFHCVLSQLKELILGIVLSMKKNDNRPSKYPSREKPPEGLKGTISSYICIKDLFWCWIEKKKKQELFGGGKEKGKYEQKNGYEEFGIL